MPKFRIELSARVIVETDMIVRADSSEDAREEALKCINDVVWRYAGLDYNDVVNPVEITDVTET